MRAAGVTLILLCACGRSDAVRGAGSSGGPPADSGAPAADAGLPATDAGAPAADAGAAAADAGPPATAPDAGPPIDACAGIAPPGTPAMAQHVQLPWYGLGFSCGDATSDSSGDLALVVSGGHGDLIDVVDPAGKLLATPFTSMFGFVLPQPHGFTEVSGRPYLGPDWAVQYGQMISDFDSDGGPTGHSFLANHSGQNNLPAAADPNGGVLLAGDLSVDPPDGAVSHAAVMYQGGGTSAAIRWGPNPLASPGAVFGLGVDGASRSLVITDGAPTFGGGVISAQWFDRDGAPLTGEFVLLRAFSAGTATWFDTAPLIGGGLVVRRRDGASQAQALVTLDSGATAVHDAPGWMTARPDVKLQLARGGKAYAVLPLAATGAACSQRVELVAPDGTSCGSADYFIAAGACDTFELWLGADGTVIQQLPTSMEQQFDIVGGRSCTWRWWSGAVR